MESNCLWNGESVLGQGILKPENPHLIQYWVTSSREFLISTSSLRSFVQSSHYKAHIVLGGRDVDTVLVFVYLFRGPCVFSLHWGTVSVILELGTVKGPQSLRIHPSEWKTFSVPECLISALRILSITRSVIPEAVQSDLNSDWVSLRQDSKHR